MKLKCIKKFMTNNILLISILLILFIFSTYTNEFSKQNYTLNHENIITYIKEAIEKQNLSTEKIEKINQYLSNKDHDSEYYFINGFLDYINNNYKEAIENLDLASKNIAHSDLPFIKIYTYILLNESLQKENKYDSLIKNCETALNYISEKDFYKNDVTLIWRTISVLLNNEKQIQESISLLNSYLNNTNGLTDESIVRLTANIGQLYSLVYKYSDSMYNYLDAINIINSTPSMPNKNYYKTKLLTAIGDINFILNEYENAIDYYDKSLNITLSDKKIDALTKSFTIINKCQAYIELSEYKAAAELVTELNNLYPYIYPGVKDDIEILYHNILALTNTYEHNFEKAEEHLINAKKLLEEDTVEFSLNKDIFINLTYAQWYKEQKLYDKSLPLYNDLLIQSINKGLGLEDQIYKQISEIYRDKQDLNNYIKYNELYINQIHFNTQIFKKDYIKYMVNWYENNLLKQKSQNYKFNILIMLFTLIILLIIVLSKTILVKKLRNSNFTDSMTGLNNRKYLDYYMIKNKKNLLNKLISVIIIDIDYFKKYNDNYGHIEGDKIIKEVANVLKSSVRKSDISIRYGGEEMVLILSDISPNDIEAIAQKIQTNLKNKNIEHKYSEISNILTISIGVYTTKFSNQNIYNLINKADTALYKAKKQGRNRYELLFD
ncbi:GGDEF domain-containing protein [Clostridium sp. D53t1_180928_C8]|uniref:tetratricopeptide repeat-containing diguanylate cyclase n=1 Tax=Clostridium sp. D53t1_180928_C8 TaxID=2787101 RepID=UPI0018A93B5F|nr:GGDEF domain-containing protein [Clostridium sp. D53t1_180928_C8]